MFKLDKNVRRLTQKEILKFEKDGYLTGLPLFDNSVKSELDKFFILLSSRLDKNIDLNQTAQWQKASRLFYDLSTNPSILNYVEDLIGPDFFLWGGQFFLKEPKDGSVVPWHQDAQYWPLKPAKAVTVWLALYDTDEQNGAMKIVKASHHEGMFNHHQNDAKHLALNQEVSTDQFNANDIISLNLKAGEISLHDDGLLHGSEANESDRRRCGITLRYSPVEVKADLSVWPHFETQLVRGNDKFCYNPIAKIPKGEATPNQKFQYSKEFEVEW